MLVQKEKEMTYSLQTLLLWPGHQHFETIFHYIPGRFSTELLKENFLERFDNIDGSIDTGNASSTVQFISSCPSADTSSLKDALVTNDKEVVSIWQMHFAVCGDSREEWKVVWKHLKCVQHTRYISACLSGIKTNSGHLISPANSAKEL